MRTYLMSSHAAMALVALRVINILLLKEYLDQPLVVLGWIAAGAALFLRARRAARRTTPAARSRVQTWYAALDGSDLALFALLLVMVFLFHWGFARAASDGREYFMQVRSLVIDGDLDFTNETTLFRGRGTTDIYAFGTPLLWAPFFTFRPSVARRLEPGRRRVPARRVLQPLPKSGRHRHLGIRIHRACPEST